jgi:hypothetical protein
LRILVEHGADITAKDKEGAQPIHYAAYFRMKLCIETLNPNTFVCYDSKGWTPFHYGCLPLPQAFFIGRSNEKNKDRSKSVAFLSRAGKREKEERDVRSQSPSEQKEEEKKVEQICPALSPEGKPLHLVALLGGTVCSCFSTQFIPSADTSCSRLLCARDKKVFFSTYIFSIIYLSLYICACVYLNRVFKRCI